jgi:NAD-dependent SIR2 family protein deacetylase
MKSKTENPREFKDFGEHAITTQLGFRLPCRIALPEFNGAVRYPPQQVHPPIWKPSSVGSPDMTIRKTIDSLARFMSARRSVVVLTGAGCSTESGIPDYRDADGNLKHKNPVLYAEFRDSERVRRRYWSRSVVGWKRVVAASPNAGHRALAVLEGAGVVRLIVTQNVDGLHQRAGSSSVVDLHGNLSEVECLTCKCVSSRADLQAEIERLNGGSSVVGAEQAAAPDGDAALREGAEDLESFRVPACAHCGGILKPAVVFFGESVPPRRVAMAVEAIERADALLVVGSSLAVFSGYRFARLAHRSGVPIAIVNLGKTRADGLATLKVDAAVGSALSGLCSRLGLSHGNAAERLTRLEPGWKDQITLRDLRRRPV